MDEYKCSNPKCGVPITKRQARLTEVFMGRGNPLCLSCYDGGIYDARTKILHDEMMARQKAKDELEHNQDQGCESDAKQQ